MSERSLNVSFTTCSNCGLQTTVYYGKPEPRCKCFGKRQCQDCGEWFIAERERERVCPDCFEHRLLDVHADNQ